MDYARSAREMIASRPPQQPSDTPADGASRMQPAQPSWSDFDANPRPNAPGRTPSSNYYAEAVAKATKGAGGSSGAESTARTAGVSVDTTGSGQDNAGSAENAASPSSATWRPALQGRQQSWSDQDRRRVMQEGLMSPVEEKQHGFTTAEK